MHIARAIDQAYRGASQALVMGTSPSALARARERAFAKRLIELLLASNSDDDIRAFSQLARGNKVDFGSETLLSAITVARVGSSQASNSGSESFVYLAGLIWQIEIEFSRDFQRLVYAINRLNCGAAENKLLICARASHGAADIKASLREPFSAGSGNAYLAFVPHPAEWDASDEMTAVWQLVDGAWTAVEA